ncbi:HAUS augmin-like complex subunit 1, partial [Tauraco erythrolophus]
QVTSWLKKIYGNQPIPQYEVNAWTVDFLYELAERSEARDRDVSLLIEDTKREAEEYEAKANYLQSILMESLGLSMSCLSSEGISFLDVLVNSAMTLETKDTSLTSFFCAINDMTSEIFATQSKVSEMERKLKKMMKKLTIALTMETQLEADVQKTEEQLQLRKLKADCEFHKMKFLRAKSEDLKIRIKAAEEELLAMGLDQSLTHESLVNLSEEVASLQKEVVVLEKDLEAYQDLPPVTIISTVLL